ncbi:MAG TPA: HTTM domain-containing protein, partial [Myxococcales bacterium]|nr:HTTM domain-containing protein [Myxococcales bacterium]
MYTPIALFTIMGIASVLGAIAIFTRLPDDHPHKNPQLSLANRLFGIDLRSLAFFRVALGSMVISDILHRIPDMTAHYTDQGILPRADLISKFLGKWILSLHMWNGTEVGVTLIFGFTIFCGICLLMGYRTKLFTFLCWLLIISLHGRNHMVLQAGDVLFRLLLFWAMFLPIGARFSVDSALNSNADSDPPPRRILTIAGLAILIQTGLVYVFSAAMKTHAHWWPNGEAVYLAISIDHFATPVAHFLLNYPQVMKYLTLSTFLLEWAGAFFLFIPVFTGPIRIGLVLAFWGLHVGFGATLLIGMFVFVSAASWIPYIPSYFWDRIAYAWEKRRSSAVQIFYDGECNFCAKGVRLLKTFLILPKAELLTGQSSEDISKLMDKENSWVVVTPDGKRYLRSKA